MASTAYFLTAAARCAKVSSAQVQTRWPDQFQVWDACIPKIVFGRSGEDAQTLFETSLQKSAEGEEPQETIIRKITQTPFVDQLLTESTASPLDWPNILKQMEFSLGATPVDDFEQGYWVDVDQVVQRDKLSFSAGTLESEVPEDIRSGLNWSGNKQFFFLFSILAPPPPPPADPYPEPETARPELAEPIRDNAEPHKELSPEELYETFPDACNKKAVVLVQARNSVVAAWLWRRYAVNTPFSANQIRIEPWPGTLGNP
jgi:hypothetical protein